jgi:pSer/pThr/pTyr-binding forkhead associated (FHA) protein
MKNPPIIIVQLIHIHGGMKGQIQEFSEPVVTIGRVPSFTLHFPPNEPGVSREHAKIVRDGNQFKLVALNDTFGTFVNGKQIKETVLRNGDVIEFGTGGPKVSFNTEISTAVTDAEQDASYSAELPPVQVSSSPRDDERRAMPRQASAFARSSPANSEAPWNGHQQEVPEPVFVNSPKVLIPSDSMDRMDVPLQRVSAPLVIQFGPTIRTYSELPVIIGKHSSCGFVLKHAGMYDQHAQILFSHGSYWIKDLTGQSQIKINGVPIGSQARLNQADELECSPRGPVFRFLGEGRLAEVEPVESVERSTKESREAITEPQNESLKKSFSPGLLSRFVKRFK